MTAGSEIKTATRGVCTMIVAAMRRANTVLEDILPAGVTREYGSEPSLGDAAQRGELVVVGR